MEHRCCCIGEDCGHHHRHTEGTVVGESPAQCGIRRHRGDRAADEADRDGHTGGGEGLADRLEKGGLVILGEGEGEAEHEYRRDDAVVVSALDIQQMAHTLGKYPGPKQMARRGQVGGHHRAGDEHQHGDGVRREQEEPEDHRATDRQGQRDEEQTERGPAVMAEKAPADLGRVDEQQEREDDLDTTLDCRTVEEFAHVRPVQQPGHDPCGQHDHRRRDAMRVQRARHERPSDPRQ